MPFLKFAKLNYGSRAYAVESNETTPLPLQFDFSDPAECARKVFAIMSNASGGHTLRGCRVRYHVGRRTANLTCSGAHVYYAPGDLPPMDPNNIVRFLAECVTIELGDVVTDQYGDGWKRAVWLF